ncbi:MAG: trimethylamine methyltransferase family protein, partial [Eggerthellaceae bacterium]|nr:trimethylamine methyltransferase family protein [Eggerthellaceae bacterium]
LKMIEAHAKYSDKPFMGVTHGTVCAKDTVDMCKILFGLDDDGIKKTPILNSLINSITPLKFDERMASACMTYAEYGQSNMVSSLVMSGSTGPVTMVETLSLQLAETIAGLCLCQLINPGTPVILGSTSGPADMGTMALSIGNAEVGLYTAATAQMGRFYGVPTRGGGGLNDAILSDAQAGYESMLTLLMPALAGTAFILHAAGIMHYYNAFSYEKFILDDEIAGWCNKFIQGYNFDEERFVFDDVEEVGPGGHFLYQESTMDFVEELRRPLVSNRKDYEGWDNAGHKALDQVCYDRWNKQLAEYERPALDESVEKDLNDFIVRRCGELGFDAPALYV